VLSWIYEILRHWSPLLLHFAAHRRAAGGGPAQSFRPLPGGFGNGSGTLARWIQLKLDGDKRDAARKPNAQPGKQVARKNAVALLAVKEAKLQTLEEQMTRYNPATKADLDAALAPIKRLRVEIAAIKAQFKAGKQVIVLPPVDQVAEDARKRAAVQKMLEGRQQELGEYRAYAKLGGELCEKKKARVAFLQKEIARLQAIP